MNRSWRPFASNGRPAQRWLAVLDTRVLVSAFLGTHESSGSIKTVEAAVAGVFDCVLSEYIRNECRVTLNRHELGSHTPDETDQRFQPLWDRVIWVELAEDSADLHAAVSDPGDIPILRTAMAVFSVPDLGTREHKFLVANDTKGFTSPSATARGALADSYSMEGVEVRGLEIAYERAGSGPPLVLLHGFVGDSREWRRQIDGLSDEFTVVAWDAPGAGRSKDPPASFRMPDYADCLAAFIGALDLEQPHIAGLSFGGALALELYRRHPTVPRTLILAGAYAGWTGSLPAEVAEERLRTSLELADKSPAGFVKAMIPTLFPDTTPEAVVNGFSAIMGEFHPDGFRTMARSLAEADLRDVLPKIRVPTLLVYGDRDVRASLDVAEDIHDAIPESRLVVLPGVGHMSSVQAGDELNREFRRFLRATLS